MNFVKSYFNILTICFYGLEKWNSKDNASAHTIQRTRLLS